MGRSRSWWLWVMSPLTACLSRGWEPRPGRWHAPLLLQLGALVVA